LIRRSHCVTAIVMGVAALLAGWAFVPRGREVALMRLRDKQFEAALVEYEARYQSGDLSAPTVGALTDIYLQHGMVGKAINLLEQYLVRHPEDLQARRRLGTYYQFDQQPLKFVENLEKITAANASEKDLRELARGYSFFRRIEDQVRIVRRLIAQGHGSAADYRDLANLLGSLGKTADAAQVMTAYERTGKKFDHEMAEMILRLRLDTQDWAGAVEGASRAARWLNDADAADLAANFRAHGRPADGITVLLAHGEPKPGNPAGLWELTAAEIAVKRQPAAFARLDRMAREGVLPCALAEPWLMLGLELKAEETVYPTFPF